MVRGRAPARGTRRGAASGGTQRPAADAPAPTPAPTSTDAPAASSSETTPARRGGTTRATRAPAGGRFRPKIVRRDEADRDSLARQEEKKASERAAEERKARGRSRFRSKRSRGDTMGRGGFGRIISGASGPFSSGIGGTSRGGGWFGSGGGGGGIGGGSGGGFGGRGIKSDSKGPNFAQGRDVYREARINADKLHIMPPEDELDSEDEAMIVALSSKDSTKMPMGIYRKEHKEAGIIVATTAELEAKENATGEEESLWVDGESGTLPPEAQPEEGVWGTDSKRLIKEEPGADDNVMDVDLEALPKMEDKAAAAAAAAAATPAKVKKAPPQDPESKMIQSDLDLLARELGAVTVNDESAPELANKDGRLYLFQFPPLMPPLKETSAAPSGGVKEEQQPASTVSLDDVPAASTAVDLTGEQDNGEDDDEEEETEEERAEAERKHGFKSQFLSQGGMIGRINVRRSGKVELDWGGHVLEMSPAAGMSFLTTAVIVEESDEKPVVVGGGAVARPTGGDCVGMGKIMGRFTVAPVWSDEEDWNVTPEELGEA